MRAMTELEFLVSYVRVTCTVAHDILYSTGFQYRILSEYLYSGRKHVNDSGYIPPELRVILYFTRLRERLFRGYVHR